MSLCTARNFTEVCSYATAANPIVNVDYAVIGAGVGGLTAAADLAGALGDIGTSDETVVVLEKDSRVGGRFYSVDLAVQPTGYAGPPLRVDVGARRVPPVTCDAQRKLFAENNVTTFSTAFRNHVFGRGRDKLCEAPESPGGFYGDFCSYDDVFVGAGNPAFLGLQDIEDPSYEFYSFIFGYADVHPVSGTNCDEDSSACASTTCANYADWRSFIMGEFGPEYAELINIDNVGFLGDQFGHFDACAYLEWMQREWDTSSQNAYPERGMSSLTDALLLKAEAYPNLSVNLNEPALCVNRVDESTHRYVIHTDKAIYQVKQFLFLGINHDDIVGDGVRIEGNVMNDIRNSHEMTLPKKSPVDVIVFQWNPNEPAWFLQLLDNEGKWSRRMFGDIYGLSRMEILDTPVHRQHNALSVVYSDYEGSAMWSSLIATFERTGDSTPIVKRVMLGLNLMFPNITIPEPVAIYAKHWEAGWYLHAPVQAGNDPVSFEEMEEFGVNTLGADCEKICFVSETVDPLHYAWADSAIRASNRCLSSRFVDKAKLNDRLQARLAARDAIYDSTLEFDAPVDQFLQLTNERYAPYGCMYNIDNGALLNGYNSEDAAACEASRPKYSSTKDCPFGCPVDDIQDEENTEAMEIGIEVTGEMAGSGEENPGTTKTIPGASDAAATASNTSMSAEDTSSGDLGSHSATTPLSLLNACFFIIAFL